ncbi:lipopolysaccharide biosynthesis protein [Clostridium botulinum]|uniref:lipopolysaccharide biosynthesis protein n=1 Tax=Clostridium botulinum TaxID=1491 RepID=UPI0007736808|nr:lipopolysaccharide biosynthesis protein [Clostridium botulinum]NFE95395.1 lipopolysaccharide biosynthesis protein [Clostridium botulinum]NFL38236.1 lipopolysaccharide biosynthesis protein [Clostridium botulinum]NFL64715.1 lipopolysaccharide biosynthesis protein [Clostridium botulinum]NFN08037.1 lipopolysaccharide biosynthesis protein [Clostridium botulinum]NFN24236.1 lipopolysaccharide biosynthesis protein [Clostridium botulinum]
MKNQNIKSKVISSLIWKILERGGTQGIQFLVQIILARVLAPNDYGIISLIAIFITIANVFVQSGFNTALIQKKEADEKDFSSVFYLSLFVATLLYILLFFISPCIANFYGMQELVSVLRVLSITLFFGALNSIQNAVIAKRMQFKNLFFSSLASMVLSGCIGIILAYAGFGVWALVTQQLINQFLITVILWFTVKWRPNLTFSFERVKMLFSYGWKLLVSALIDTLYMNLRSLIIGKIYNPAMLGFYNRGDQFPQLIVSNINGSIQSVMLPALSSEQSNRQRVKEMVRRSIVTSSFIVFPIMIGLAVIGEPLIKILLTDKWLPCVPFLQVFCLSYALWPIHTANLQAINALGRSDIFLKLEIIKKIIGITILVVSMFYGVYAIAIGTLVSGIISTFINAYPNLKLLNYSYKEQWKDIMPSLILSLVMGIFIYTVQWLHIKAEFILILQICSGVIIYVTMAKIFKLECFIYLLNTIKNRKRGE